MDPTTPGREAAGFRDLRERNPHSRIPFCARKSSLHCSVLNEPEQPVRLRQR